MVVIVGAGHELARLTSVAPQQLAQLPYVSREPGSGTREFADEYLRRAGINSEDLNVVMGLGSPEAGEGHAGPGTKPARDRPPPAPGETAAGTRVSDC